MPCKEWYEERRSQCQRSEDQGYQTCAEQRDTGYQQCSEERDLGYSTCAEQRDLGYSACESWHPWFQWLCVVSVWISNVVCVAWTWISNIVCVAWTWISNIVCVAWTWISNMVCVLWTEVSTFFCRVWEAIAGGGSAPLDEGNLDNLPEFPPRFLWGVATAAYQVEGSITNCDWEAFTTSPAIRRRVAKLTNFALGRQVDLEPAAEAIYHRDLAVLRQDLERARFLGMNCYRFSVEWCRLQPRRPNSDDSGALDSEAAAYYDAVLDLLQEFEMTPVVTLNHLTLPLWVLDPPRESSITSLIGLPTATEDAVFRASLRGWESAETVAAFVRFVSEVARRYRDRVEYWITLNEPVGSMIGVGYIGGVWPPGFSLSGSKAKDAYFNLLRAHVGAYDAIKAVYLDTRSQVGIAHAMLFTKASGASPVATGAAVGAATGAVVGGIVGLPIVGAVIGGAVGAIAGGVGNIHEAARNQFDYFYNDHILESLTSGQVDAEIHRRPDRRRNIEARTFYGLSPEAAWFRRLDFIGINYYRSVYPYYDQIIAIGAGYTGAAFENDLRASSRNHQLLNDLGWEVCPVGLYGVIDRARQYNVPILVTENGIPQEEDRTRAPFIIAHLQQLLRSIRDGVDVLGYIHWTIVDNFEWQEHYTRHARFGLFMREHPDQTRRITEGAFGLRYLVSDGKIAQVLDRYGSIRGNGQRVIVPSLSSGSMWVASGDAGAFRLFISQRSSGEIDASIFLIDAGRWLSASAVVWNGAKSELRFSFPHPSGFATFWATLDGSAFRGGWSSSRREGDWSAYRLPPFGLWRASTGTVPFDLVVFNSFEHLDRWTGKWVTDGNSAEWKALEFVAWNQSQLQFMIGHYSYTAAVDRDTMTGVYEWSQVGTSSRNRPRVDWSATRVNAGLPF
jgi:beta-glucosidase